MKRKCITEKEKSKKWLRSYPHQCLSLHRTKANFASAKSQCENVKQLFHRLHWMSIQLCMTIPQKILICFDFLNKQLMKFDTYNNQINGQENKIQSIYKSLMSKSPRLGNMYSLNDDLNTELNEISSHCTRIDEMFQEWATSIYAKIPESDVCSLTPFQYKFEKFTDLQTIKIKHTDDFFQANPKLMLKREPIVSLNAFCEFLSPHIIQSQDYWDAFDKSMTRIMRYFDHCVISLGNNFHISPIAFCPLNKKIICRENGNDNLNYCFSLLPALTFEKSLFSHNFECDGHILCFSECCDLEMFPLDIAKIIAQYCLADFIQCHLR